MRGQHAGRAAVLVSLYPGFTVLLARTLLHERFRPAQHAGLGLAAVPSWPSR